MFSPQISQVIPYGPIPSKARTVQLHHELSADMGTGAMLLLIILFVLLLGGGGGYYGYSRWGAGGGLGVVGTVLLIVLIIYLLGGI